MWLALLQCAVCVLFGAVLGASLLWWFLQRWNPWP
jgi:hypothetical protein